MVAETLDQLVPQELFRELVDVQKRVVEPVMPLLFGRQRNR